ncbi:MAG: penicillin-binding protein [Erysipelotrichaceae bacterium]|nr:penicillin-binding protein [Erysipelotrichaceae bacterium]
MKRSNRMLRIIYTIALIAVLLCVINVFLVAIGKIHIRSNTSLNSYVQSVSLVSETIYAKRGNIYDANGQIVAQDEKTYDIICYLDSSRKRGNKPAYIDDPLYTSQVLSNYLNMEQADIYYYLTYNPKLYQTELGLGGRNLSEETVDAILSYPNIHGIGFKESNKRIYPQGDAFAPYLIGFAQSDENGKLVGKMGLENYLNEELSGTDGKHIYQQDKNGYILTGMYEDITPADNGFEIYTTIDSSIQQALETAFDDVESQNNASKAWGAVVEIDTGKIKAWGQTPSFNPNTLDIEDYMNMGSQVPYEPGSVMKAFIYATAMDIGNYNGDTTFNSEAFCYYAKGSRPYRVYGSPSYGCISNAAGKSWGTIPLDYGLIYSSNVATATLLTDYVGVDTFSEYLDKFGFFKTVDSDGIAEAPGYKNYTWPSEKLALTYGQGSSVTMLQLLQAYTSIFGNGEMLKPYYIDKIVDTDNKEVVYQGQRTVVGTPIKESTAKQMQALLERVVSDKVGTAKYYAVDEVNIMAKTGTSEIVEGSGYNSNDSITSVMLAFPADKPQYMIYFAYVSPYNYYNHTYSTPIKDLIKRVAILTEVGYNPSDAQISDPIVKQEMPDVIGMDLNEAKEVLSNEYKLDVIEVGNGDKVYKQLPEKGDIVYSHGKAFVFSGGNGIIIPDFTGWTRKEVMEFWNISNVPITLNGYGVAASQSLPKGSLADENTEVIVNFEQIESNIDVSVPVKDTGE